MTILMQIQKEVNPPLPCKYWFLGAKAPLKPAYVSNCVCMYVPQKFQKQGLARFLKWITDSCKGHGRDMEGHGRDM